MYFMRKILIFKCEGLNKGLVHVYLVRATGKAGYYEIRRNRRLIEGVCMFINLNDAIEAAVTIAVRDVIRVSKEEMS